MFWERQDHRHFKCGRAERNECGTWRGDLFGESCRLAKGLICPLLVIGGRMGPGSPLPPSLRSQEGHGCSLLRSHRPVSQSPSGWGVQLGNSLLSRTSDPPHSWGRRLVAFDFCSLGDDPSLHGHFLRFNLSRNGKALAWGQKALSCVTSSRLRHLSEPRFPT